ncbi:MAG: acetylornithine deacetylase [Gemmobacter sp.]
MDQATARAVLDRLVAFPSVSRDSNLDLIRWVADWLAGHGIPATVVMRPCGTKAQLFAQAGPDAPGGVILSGHSDVVPVDGQAWTSDPFTLTERAGRLYGRGTADMKGFVALAIAALPLAQAAGIRRPLQLALSCDEELGCVAVQDLIPALDAALARASAVIVGEPTRMKVVTGHKGGAGWTVHAKGHAVHSSLLPEGVSAIMEAARLIDWANDRNAELQARPPAPLAAAFHPPFTTLHAGMIDGGTAHNITAADCRFSLEVRVVPGEDLAGWIAAVEAEAARIAAAMQSVRPATGITLDRYFTLPPVTPEPDGAAERLARRLTGDNGLHVVSYGTEGGHFQAAGYSTVVCGPGDIAQAHQADEYLALSEFAAGWTFMERLVADLRD